MRVAGPPAALSDRQSPLASHASCTKKLPLATMAAAVVADTSTAIVPTLPPPVADVR